jgi:glucose/arabinose dehydrogenase
VVGNSAALGTEVVFMEPDTVANYHHGGGLAFGPDGKLYWGKGDNQVGANAQDLTNMYGKILRFKSDGSTPSDNPVLPVVAADLRLRPAQSVPVELHPDRPVARRRRG